MRKAHAPNNELPPETKSFSDFYENLQKCSLGKINLPYFGKSAKNFFLLEKNPTSNSKIGGFCDQKSFFDFYENLQKCSLGKINLPYFGKSAKNFFYWKKIQLQVSKSANFGSNSLWVIGTF